MTNLSPNPDKSAADKREPLRHRTPLWVKGFLIATAILAVTFAVIHLSGGMAMNHTP